MVKFIVWLFRIIIWFIILLIPLSGVWIASSLAAFVNSVPWLALLAGLLLFPILPVAWDLYSESRRAKKKEAKKNDEKEEKPRIMTRSDRIFLRTMALNILFLTVLSLFFSSENV